MAMTVAQLLIKLGVDDKDVHERLDKASQHTKEASGGFKSMLSNAISFAGAAIGVASVGDAVGFVTDQLKDTLKVAMQQQQVEAQLTAGIKSTKDASGETVKGLVDMAAGYAKLNPFTKQAIEQSQAVTLTFTNIGKEVFPGATQAALDLSTRMGEDLPNATLQLDKALADPIRGITALRREGVEFTKQQQEQIKAMVQSGNTMGAQKLILAEMGKEFGGSAQAAGKTFAGALAIAGNQLDDMKETIGNAVLPILAQLLQNLAPIVTALASALPGAIATVQRFLVPLFAQVQGAITGGGALAMFKGLLGDLIPLVQRIATTFTTSILPVLQTLWQQIVTNVLPALVRIVDTVMKNLAPAILHLVSVIAPILMPILGVLGWTLGHVVGPALELIINIVATLVDMIAGLIGKIGDFLGLLGKIKDASGGFAGLASGGGIHIPGFAVGGTTPGGPIIAGERGPELLIPPTGTRVIPLPGGLAGGFGSGGGSSQVIELHNHIHLDGRQIAETVVRHVPSVIRNATGVRAF